MRVVCPSCHSAYDVPEARLGRSAQRLRCARCGHVWAFAPSVPAPPDPAPSRSSAPLLGVPSRAAAPRSVTPGVVPPLPRVQVPPAWHGSGPVAGWLLTVVLLAGLGFAAWHWRQPIMAAWPPSERVYRLFGAD